MCGRFTLRTTPNRLVQQLGLPGIPELEPPWEPRYNIAPTQEVAAVRAAGDDQREWAMLRWGLIPSWADTAAVGNRWINARGETADTTAAFRSAFQGRRCLVLADGFYEWESAGGRKQPYYLHADGEPFAFAGLWECWRREEPAIESCTILTTDANPRVAKLHDRMPVILPPESYDVWLDPEFRDTAELKRLLVPCDEDFLQLRPVSPKVNQATYDAPDCLEPAATQSTLPGF